MRYFLQLVEAIINKRINNAIKLDGFLRVLEKVEEGEIQMINILGADKVSPRDISFHPVVVGIFLLLSFRVDSISVINQYGNLLKDALSNKSETFKHELVVLEEVLNCSPKKCSYNSAVKSNIWMYFLRSKTY